MRIEIPKHVKYFVYPDYVISGYDGDKHYVDSHVLMELYKVNPRECMIFPRPESRPVDIPEHIKILRPRRDGNRFATNTS